MATLPCPYLLPNGQRCPGHIVKIEAFNADLSWSFHESGKWTFNHSQPRSQYRLFCSEKGDHMGNSATAEELRLMAAEFFSKAVEVENDWLAASEDAGSYDAGSGDRPAVVSPGRK